VTTTFAGPICQQSPAQAHDNSNASLRWRRQEETTMNTQQSHSSIRPATVDRSNPNAPKRTFAKSMVSNSRRLRQRIGVGMSLCLGLAALVVALE
jgi:hypothetical protein